MKNTLLSLLARVIPSQIIIDNCIELIQREQTGLNKYGVSLTDAKLTHEQVLQHLLEEQLDAANYIRKALMTASTAHTDYALLRKEIERALAEIQNLRYGRSVTDLNSELAEDAYIAARDDAAEVIKEALFRFDSGKVCRDLRQ